MSRKAYLDRTWPVLFAADFQLEFAALPAAVQTELLARARLLEQFGPLLGRPAVDTLKGSRFVNMKELRFDAEGGVWRIAFAFDTRRCAVLLVAGNKAGVSQHLFYRLLIARADKRFESHLEGTSVKDKSRTEGPASVRTLEEIMQSLPATQRQAVERRTNELFAEELSLAELRKSLQITQVTVAKRLKKGQDRVSRIEHNGDILLSTLQDYLESLGGELDLLCRFKDRPAVRLKIRSPESRASTMKRRPRPNP